MNSVTFPQHQQYYINQKIDSGAFISEARQWGYAIGLPVVGLLILYFFLSLGGAFALLGSCVIFIAARLLTSYWDEQVCNVQTTEGTIGQHFVKFTQLNSRLVK